MQINVLEMTFIIIRCSDSDLNNIFNYIGEDYGKCLYIFIDLKKYALLDENFKVWIQYNNQNEICALISEYHKGIQIYSKKYDLLAEEISVFLKKLNPNVIFAMEKTINLIKCFLPEYHEEVGNVAKLNEIKLPFNKNAYSASLEEMPEIVNLVVSDEDIGQPYGYDSLFTQYYGRKKDNFGRNFIIRDKISGDIVAHAATYAEIPELAVIGGVITAVPYRGKGLSKSVVTALCYNLKSECKEVFSFYYVPISENLHNSVGFEVIGKWAKLIK